MHKKGGKLLFLLKGGFEDFQDLGREANFHLDLEYFLKNDSKIVFGADSFCRIPSFTELYYSSPANKGNSNLEVQHTHNYQVGFKYTFGNLFAGLLFFFRNQRDTIDWVKSDVFLPWEARNLGRVSFRGLDLSLGNLGIPKFRADYTYLELNRENPYNFSKYLFDYDKHKLTCRYSFAFVGFKFNLWAEFCKPVKRKKYFTADLKITKNIGNFSWNIEALNVFNSSYQELEDIPGTPRWFKLALSWHF